VIGSKGDFTFGQLCWLILGGFLVTGSSNAFNQVIERDLDKLMDRTKNRPLPAGRMSVTEAMVAAIFMGVTGILILWFFYEPIMRIIKCTVTTHLHPYLYPFKKGHSFFSFYRAIPGAFPPLLGYVAARNEIGYGGIAPLFPSIYLAVSAFLGYCLGHG